jgi:hypothetical protein
LFHYINAHCMNSNYAQQLTPLRPLIRGPRLPKSAPISDPPPSPSSSSPPCAIMGFKRNKNC